MDDLLWSTRKRIAEAGAILYARGLTDAAGGNLSARAGERICMTPRYAGSRLHWNLRPDQVLVLDGDGNRLEGEGEVSREVKVHVRVLADLPDANVVLHGHARNTLVFCAARRPMPPVLEYMHTLGEIPVAQFAPSHSTELAESVSVVLRRSLLKAGAEAAAVLVPWHGLFVVAADLDLALDAAERIENNARCILLGSLVRRDPSWVQEEAEALASAMRGRYSFE